jgi:hypothetical protein
MARGVAWDPEKNGLGLHAPPWIEERKRKVTNKPVHNSSEAIIAMYVCMYIFIRRAFGPEKSPSG